MCWPVVVKSVSDYLLIASNQIICGQIVNISQFRLIRYLFMCGESIQIMLDWPFRYNYMTAIQIFRYNYSILTKSEVFVDASQRQTTCLCFWPNTLTIHHSPLASLLKISGGCFAPSPLVLHTRIFEIIKYW